MRQSDIEYIARLQGEFDYQYRKRQEAETRVDAIRALLPKVYDGMHLVDCPYVDVLIRIKKALDD